MTDKLFTKRLRDLTDDAIRESLAEISVEFEKRFGPAALTASPPVVEREAIARIIDPEAWVILDKHFKHAPEPDFATSRYRLDKPDEFAAPSLAKADAILALIPVEGVGEKRCGDAGADLCAACSLPAHELTQEPGCGGPLPLSTPVAQGDEVRAALAERLEQISFTHFSAGLPGSIMEANRATIDQTIAILRQGQTDATLAAIKAWADTSLMRDHTPRELGAIYGGDVETAAQKTLATLTKGARDAG